jgi:hypothetical protein
MILKMRDIIFVFLQPNYFMGHCKGYFEGAKTIFLRSEGQFGGQNSRGTREMAH